MADQKIKLTVDGESYEIEPGGFTANEAKLFRREVGMGLFTAMAEFFSGRPDSDIIAGLLWLHRRRADRRLTYESVADKFTIDDLIEMVESDLDENEVTEDDAPGNVRRALLKKLPALTSFYGLKPWEVEDLTFDEVGEFLRQFDGAMTKQEAAGGA